MRLRTERDYVDKRSGKMLTVSLGYHGKVRFKVGNQVAILTPMQANTMRKWLNQFVKDEGGNR